MPAYITPGEVFTSVAPGKSVTPTRLNNHVGALTILPAFITDQTTATSATIGTDYVLIHSAAASAFRKILLSNFFLQQPIDAAAGTGSLRTLGFTGTKAAPGIDTPALDPASGENAFLTKNRFLHISGTIGITIAANTNLGTTGTATLDAVATDMSGIISLTPGGTGIATGLQATVTFGASFSFVPHITLTPYNQNAIAAQTGAKALGVSSVGANTFTMTTASAALTTGVLYQYVYKITGS